MADSFAKGPGFYNDTVVCWGIDSVSGALLPKDVARDIGSATSPVGGVYSNSATIGPTANGAKAVDGAISEEITLSTSGLTTDSSTNLLPANSVILGGVAYVTTAITGNTITYALGDSSTADRFTDAVGTTALAAGQTNVFANIYNPAKAAGYSPYQAAAAKLRVTATSGAGNPLTGKIRVTVFYRTFTPPTS